MEFEAEAEPAPPPPRRRNRRPKPLPGSRRGTRRGARGHVPMAVGGLLVAAVALFLGMRWTRRSPGGATAPAGTDSRTASQLSAPTVAPSAASKSTPQSQRPVVTSAANPLTASGPGTAEPPPKPVRRGIEAA